MSKKSECPNCGMELPEALLGAHVAGCDEEPQSTVRSLPDDDMFPELDAPMDLDPLGTMDEREGSGGVGEISIDSEFEKLVGMLDLSDIGPMIPDVNVTLLDDAELSRRFNETREELMSRGEMINCSTQTGRDLHSQRAAYIIELRKRGLMK